MSIPYINRTNEVSTDRRGFRRGYPDHTIENRGEQVSGEIALFSNVHTVWDLWSIRIIGPGFEPKVRHGPGMCAEAGFRCRGGPEVRRGGSTEVEKTLLDSTGWERREVINVLVKVN